MIERALSNNDAIPQDPDAPSTGVASRLAPPIASRNLRILLASRSPRRRAMLTDAGIKHVAASPGFEDGGLRPGHVTPRAWVASLAYLKAATALKQNVFDTAPTPAPPSRDVALGADTAIVKGDQLIGTPESPAEATAILRSLRNGRHQVVSGLALICPTTGKRELHADAAEVRLGALNDDDINAYVGSGDWRGKAGGYNLYERLSAGWPIEFHGEPTTIMGLPMPLLLARLDAWAASRPSE